ncbi:hypothetical protein [Ammoniphilus sp. YIM 78166]|uniref:hypothetical protein n=1 Tax=Ammoniphilus sp. YIM 78166 TaxID=1644106 RepID=UPI00106FC235|nr:hypothetical protein [Ammoniphilus sp. YIM 78166]
MNRQENQNMITQTAKTIKDGADTAFDTVENAVEAAAQATQRGLETVESTAMNAVDEMADAAKNMMKRMNRDE